MLKENISFVKASKSPLARLCETSVFLKHLSLSMENTPKVAFPLGGLARLAETSVFLKHLSLSMDPSGGVSLEIGQFRINGARGAKNVHSMQAAAPNPEKCAHIRIIACI